MTRKSYQSFHPVELRPFFHKIPSESYRAEHPRHSNSTKPLLHRWLTQHNELLLAYLRCTSLNKIPLLPSHYVPRGTFWTEARLFLVEYFHTGMAPLELVNYKHSGRAYISSPHLLKRKPSCLKSLSLLVSPEKGTAEPSNLKSMHTRLL